MNEAQRALEELSSLPGVSPHSSVGLLVGCSYLRNVPAVARDIVIAATRILGKRLRLIGGCCGAPLLYAGDRKGFDAARRQVADAASGLESFIVADPGCAIMLGRLRPKTLLEIVDARRTVLERLGAVEQPMRWHDPCQLGRGLGLYEAPRRILERLLGGPPQEFSWQRHQASCSGGGGALPATMPHNSAAIADARIREHQRLGGGSIVTACASSLRRLGSSGASVVDLHSLIRQATGSDD
jgi:Fe-S oxidoreductase